MISSEEPNENSILVEECIPKSNDCKAKGIKRKLTSNTNTIEINNLSQVMIDFETEKLRLKKIKLI
jgi:hypothetical protein